MPFEATLARETRLVADRLRAVPFGAQVTYREITKLIGFDILSQRHCLHAARRMVLNENGAVFDVVRGVGLKRLRAEEIPSLGSAARKRVRLAARRTRHTISKAMAGFNDVEPAVRRQQLAETAILSLVEIISRDRVARKAEVRPDPLPVADTARVLLRLIGAG
jgi:hypothetical protein